MPSSSAPPSGSVILSPPALAMIWAIVFPAEVSSSSVIVDKTMSPLLSRSGASFTGLTVIAAVSVALLKAVIPPLVDASAVAPLTPEVVSQALKVIPGSIVPS